MSILSHLGISDPEIIKKKIKRFNYVSFDVYDTLLKRTVDKPTDIFKMVEKETKIDGFYELRFRAETLARKTTNKADVNIDDIYGFVFELLKSYTKCFNKDMIQNLIDKEISIEKRETYANKQIKEVFDWCKSEGKTIFISSDMYLPKSVIEDILKNNGIIGYEKIYVSGTDNVSKQKGSMFEKIIEDNSISEKELIHVGDSFISDYLRAKTHGILAVKVKK